MVKLVTAVIRPHALDAVKASLEAAGVVGLTVTEVKGFGRQAGHSETYRGAEYTVDLVPKLKVEVLCPAQLVQQVLEGIRAAASDGRIGDGKAWVLDVDHLVRLRTGEVDIEAI